MSFVDVNVFPAVRRWKFHEIAMEMLSLLVRYDTACSVQTVRVFVENTVHDSLQVRKVSMERVVYDKFLTSDAMQGYIICGALRLRGRMSYARSREPGFESSSLMFRTLGRCPNSLSCINECHVFDSDGNMRVNSKGMFLCSSVCSKRVTVHLLGQSRSLRQQLLK